MTVAIGAFVPLVFAAFLYSLDYDTIAPVELR